MRSEVPGTPPASSLPLFAGRDQSDRGGLALPAERFPDFTPKSSLLLSSLEAKSARSIEERPFRKEERIARTKEVCYAHTVWACKFTSRA